VPRKQHLTRESRNCAAIECREGTVPDLAVTECGVWAVRKCALLEFVLSMLYLSVVSVLYLSKWAGP
jgi:hypothetical protein